jgi:hypothetical protein
MNTEQKLMREQEKLQLRVVQLIEEIREQKRL